MHHRENGDIVARIVSRWRRTGFLSDADQRRLTCALQNMRMSCDSTYLLDQESDHGVKADELMTLLDELFERPDAKVVVISQWARMHELVARQATGREYLQLPLPPPETLESVAQALGSLAAALRGQSIMRG